MYDNSVRVRNIKSCFYNCSRYKHIYIAIYKVEHDFLKLSLMHLSVCVSYIGIRHDCGYLCRYILNALHHIEHIIHLTAS